MGAVQFGILACSGVARRRLLPALRLAGNAALGRVGSRDPAKAAQFAREFDAPRYGDYEAVLADGQIRAVYISTPPPLHAEWVRRAAAAGKHVLCEKPAFSGGAEARRMVQACRDAGVRLLEGYAFKYHPQHGRMQALVAAGRIGAPRFFTAEFTYPRPAGNDIRLQPELAGGVFHDSAGYPVAAALMHLPGRPVSVSCRQGRDPVSGVDDTCSITLQFPGGELANLYVGFGVSYRSRYALAGVGGRIELERAFAVPPDKPTTIVLETDAGTERIPVEPADQFRLMVEDFAGQVSGAAPRRDYEGELLRMQAVMDAAALSVAEQRIVDINYL